MLRSHPPSRWFWLAAMLVLVTLPVAQMAVAAKAGTVVCCCGEHVASDDCGCPDCPSAVNHADDHDGHDDEPGPTSADRIKRCGTDTFVGTPPGHFDLTLPIRDGQAERFRTLVPPPPLNRIDQTTSVPDSPPPERIAQL